jgi:hypothetical protein
MFRAETVCVLFYLAPRAYHSKDLGNAIPDILTPREPIAVKGVQTAHTLLIRAEVLGSFSPPEGATLGTHILPGNPYMVEAKAVKPILPRRGRSPRGSRFKEAHAQQLPDAVWSALFT